MTLDVTGEQPHTGKPTHFQDSVAFCLRSFREGYGRIRGRRGRGNSSGLCEEYTTASAIEKVSQSVCVALRQSRHARPG